MSDGQNAFPFSAESRGQTWFGPRESHTGLPRGPGIAVAALSFQPTRSVCIARQQNKGSLESWLAMQAIPKRNEANEKGNAIVSTS